MKVWLLLNVPYPGMDQATIIGVYSSLLLAQIASSSLAQAPHYVLSPEIVEMEMDVSKGKGW